MQFMSVIFVILMFNKALCENVRPDLEENISELTRRVNNCNSEKYLCSNEHKPPKICKCDNNCIHYGDCCYDKWKENKLKNFSELSFSCVTLGMHKHGILAVNSCLEEYLDSEIELMCTKNVSDDSYTHILDIPVTSEETLLTYQNYFCAVCNEDSFNLINTSMTMDCINQREFYFTDRINHFKTLHTYWLYLIFQNGTYIKPALEWNFQTYSEFYYFNVQMFCKLKIELYEDFNSFIINFNGRECFKTTTDETIQNIYNKTLQEIQVWIRNEAKCDSYTLPVYNSKTMKTFLNPSCIANSTGNLSCVPDNSQIKAYFFDNSNITVLQPSSKAKYNFSLNINSSFGSNGEWNTLLHKCSLTEDENNRTSINLINCTILNGELPNTHLKPCLSIHSIFLQRTLIEPGQYKILANDSLLVDNTVISRYTMLDDSKVFICQEKEDGWSSIIADRTIFGLYLVSLLCLIIHCVLYVTLKKNSWHGRNLFCLCITILLSSLDRVIIQMHIFELMIIKSYFTFCYIINGSMFYFNLSTAFWMNVISLNIYKTFKTNNAYRENQKKTFILSNIYAWLMPFVLLGGFTLFNYKNSSLVGLIKESYNGYFCHLLTKTGFKYFVAIPTGILLFINVALFVMSAYYIFIKSEESKMAHRNSQSIKKNDGASNITKKLEILQEKRKIAIIYLKLALLQGITWSFFYATSFFDIRMLTYITKSLNALQGIIIFVLFDFKIQWVKRIKQKVCRLNSTHSNITLQTSSTGGSNLDMSRETEISYNKEMANTTAI